MVCQKCGEKHHQGRCPKCGTLAEGLTSCPFCHAIFVDGVSICPRCYRSMPAKDEKERSLYSLWSLLSGVATLLCAVLLSLETWFTITAFDTGFRGGLLAVIMACCGVISVICREKRKSTVSYLACTYTSASCFSVVMLVTSEFIVAPILTIWCLICTTVFVVFAFSLRGGVSRNVTT